MLDKFLAMALSALLGSACSEGVSPNDEMITSAVTTGMGEPGGAASGGMAAGVPSATSFGGTGLETGATIGGIDRSMLNNDGLHPSIAGYEAMGNSVDLSLFYEPMSN
jgi:hypothetical protein